MLYYLSVSLSLYGSLSVQLVFDISKQFSKPRLICSTNLLYTFIPINFRQRLCYTCSMKVWHNPRIKATTPGVAGSFLNFPIALCKIAFKSKLRIEVQRVVISMKTGTNYPQNSNNRHTGKLVVEIEKACKFQICRYCSNE